MEDNSFLPDNKPVRACVLAQLAVPRATLELIAKGEDPADRPAFGKPAPIWGLLYISSDGLGFFVHPANNFLAFGFRTSQNSDEGKPIDLYIPFGDVVQRDMIHPRAPKTWIGKALSRFILMGEHTFVLSWKHSERAHTLRFSIAADTTAFEAALDG